ncbi:MAG: response regulator receiver sensor signal transduction histidine kinase [Bacteroidetes bacterium]|nr:response regulator receiver sensor signal transduction histidine kinase [Bacteroidota bacterium]
MEKLAHSFKAFWFCLTSVGVVDSISDYEKKYIRFTNVIAVLTAMAVVTYIPLSMFQGNYPLAILQVADAMFILAVLWLNHKNYHTLSRYTYLVVVNAFVFINSCFIGFESHVHDFFYITYIVPFLLFSVRDYKNIIFGVLIAIGFFYAYNHLYQFFTAYNLNLAAQHGIDAINLWMKFVLFGLAIYLLSYYNYITESKLAKSNQMLQAQAQELKRSNQDLEEFASVISHDLRAPVRSISSFMTLLKRRYADKLDGPAMEFIDMSQNSAERMSRQIEDMLSYSKVGRNLPMSVSVDVNATIRVIEVELGEKFRERNAKIIIAQELPKLRAVHQSMIHHIFQNLIANGIKFNNSAAPEVLISYTAEQDRYVFQIKDNGIGIGSQYKDKLFQMFKRLHKDAEFEGTGIGLAVCKKIVNFYGGEIWFESETGKGTSFFFSMPNRQSMAVIYNANRNKPLSASMAASAG